MSVEPSHVDLFLSGANLWGKLVKHDILDSLSQSPCNFFHKFRLWYIGWIRSSQRSHPSTSFGMDDADSKSEKGIHEDDK